MVSKVVLYIADDSEKTVSIKSHLQEMGDETTAALIVSAAIIALFNSGVLLEVGLKMAENPQQPIRKIIHDTYT